MMNKKSLPLGLIVGWSIDQLAPIGTSNCDCQKSTDSMLYTTILYSCEDAPYDIPNEWSLAQKYDMHKKLLNEIMIKYD